jgi:hypothetical protein
MHGLVRKGLLLSVATGALVLGGASAAMADTATVSGTANGDDGAASGNVAQIAGDNPITVCGDSADLGTAFDAALANSCSTSGNFGGIAGSATHDSGLASGNVAGAAVGAPIQVCGVSAEAVSTESGAYRNTCADTGSSATASGSTAGDEGLLTGNVLQLAEKAPISACGDAVGVIAHEDGAYGNSCGNGSETPTPSRILPPRLDCPPDADFDLGAPVAMHSLGSVL